MCALACHVFVLPALDPNASGFPSGIHGIPEEDEDSPEARHKKFEEMRKKHYDVRAIFNKKSREALKDEDEDEDDSTTKEP